MTHCGLGILGRPLYLLRVRDVDTFGAGFGAELGLRRVELGLVDVPQCDQSTLGDDAAGDGVADPGSAARDERSHGVEPSVCSHFAILHHRDPSIRRLRLAHARGAAWRQSAARTRTCRVLQASAQGPALRRTSATVVRAIAPRYPTDALT